MNLRTRPARVAAAVAVVVAAGTTTFVALTAGTAAADEPGRCTQNVNVRENPDSDSQIVALCEAGKKVELGEERDGFVRIDELDGWAAKDFVKADGSSSSSSSSDSSDHDRGSEESDRGAHTGSGGTRSSDAEDAGDQADQVDIPANTGSGGVGGLLG